MTAHMIDIEEAVRIVSACAKTGEPVEMPLADSLGLVLAAPVVSDVDQPPFDRSVMDGFAVRAADVADAPCRLRIAGQLPAGMMPDRRLSTGEAMQINTGAPIPTGADAVVRVEDTELQDGGETVLIKSGVEAGHFITRRASYVTAGDTVLGAGTAMTPLEIGAAAGAGAATVRVYKRPTVNYLVTGNELVAVEKRPVGAQIRNTNGPVLRALIETTGARPVSLGTADDDREALQSKITAGIEAEMLCITGGVSMGTFDFVPEVMETCGVSFHIKKMAIKPGRPVIFGTAPNGCLVFALPGNPAGVFVGFELLIRPALALMLGIRRPTHQDITARLDGRLAATTTRRAYRPACAQMVGDGRWSVKPLSWQGSGDTFGMATANALTMQPQDSPALGNGDSVSIVLLGGRFGL